MTTKTLWQEFIISKLAPLATDVTTDTVIIGGGLTGITTAYLLAKAGEKVVVIDKNCLYESVTAYTTAFVTRVVDTALVDLMKMYSRTDVKDILASHQHAIDLMEQIVRDEKIDCDFTRAPHYSLALTTAGYKSFERDAAVSNDLGFMMQAVTKDKFPFPNAGAFMEPEQATFHPLKYAAALRDRAIALGAQFYEDTEATGIEGGASARAATHVRVITKKGTITASSVVVATYNPFKQPWWYIFKKGMYVSYVYEVSVASGTLPHGMYEDDRNPYHYFRVEKRDDTTDRIIIGGEDHRKELPLDPQRSFHALSEYIETVLGITKYHIEHRWTGPILEQTDGLALIGLMSKKYANRFVATAFSGNGMTYATIAGEILADLIQKKKNQFAHLYRPNRRLNFWELIIKSRDYGGEFINGALRNLFRPKK